MEYVRDYFVTSIIHNYFHIGRDYLSVINGNRYLTIKKYRFPSTRVNLLFENVIRFNM